jgi:hypothetical protein
VRQRNGQSRFNGLVNGRRNANAWKRLKPFPSAAGPNTRLKPGVNENRIQLLESQMRPYVSQANPSLTAMTASAITRLVKVSSA